jgi:hypothetical protein
MEVTELTQPAAQVVPQQVGMLTILAARAQWVVEAQQAIQVMAVQVAVVFHPIQRARVAVV